MAKQDYKNHIRFYPPHHFVFYPFTLGLFIAALWFAIDNEENRLIWSFIAVVMAVIIWLAFMLRQHYALTLQNRLVIQEMRYRYFVVTGQRLEPLELKLTEGQIFSLRFAPDGELQQLTERAVKENLSADAIKKSIKNWRADNRRV